MFNSLATFVLLSFFARPILAAQCAREYTVQDGDYCDTISAAQKVSTFQLSALNPNINALCSNLVVGETLCLGLEGQDCTATYIVQPNDTCDEIQKANSVNATVFFANNPQINENCLNLYIDEVVCVSKEIQGPDKGSNPSPAPGPSPDPKKSEPVPQPAPAHPTTTEKAPLVKPTDTGGNGGNNSPSGNDGGDDDVPFCDEL